MQAAEHASDATNVLAADQGRWNEVDKSCLTAMLVIAKMCISKTEGWMLTNEPCSVTPAVCTSFYSQLL